MDELIALEKKFLAPDQANDKLADLIDDEFIEITRNGSIHTKQDVLLWLEQTQPTVIEGFDFTTQWISETVILITYKTRSKSSGLYIYRSSLWRKREDKWLFIFHQETICN